MPMMAVPDVQFSVAGWFTQWFYHSQEDTSYSLVQNTFAVGCII